MSYHGWFRNMQRERRDGMKWTLAGGRVTKGVCPWCRGEGRVIEVKVARRTGLLVEVARPPCYVCKPMRKNDDGSYTLGAGGRGFIVAAEPLRTVRDG